MKAVRIIVLLALVSLLAACMSPTRHPALKKVQKTELVRSLCRQYTNVIMFVEMKDADGVYVYVGLDKGNYTTRKAALAVRPNGTIWKKVTTREHTRAWEPVK